MKLIILAGGGGTRLYPLSNPSSPKQFLALADNKPLIINTIERFLSICKQGDIIIVTGEKYRELTQNCLKEHGYDNINVVYEPCAKNTAPAIMLGVRYVVDVLKADENESIFVVPSDHVIKPLEVYLDVVKAVTEQAKEGKVGTIGITPIEPDTGFGYIMAEKTTSKVKKVEAFKEKPDLETAKSYLKDGNYYWNAGMYAFTPRVFEVELQKHAASLAKYYEKGYNNIIESFSNVEKISIDYAIAEKSKNIVVIPFSGDWSDIGSWDAYYDFCNKDADGNVIIGSVKQFGCKNCLLLSDKGDLTVHDQNNQIIICANGNTITLPRGKSQLVKG